MSKKQTPKIQKCKKYKNSQKSIINFRTENANKNVNQICSGFFSAAKKDFIEEIKNGHF